VYGVRDSLAQPSDTSVVRHPNSAFLPHEEEEPLHRWFSGDTMLLEQMMTGTVTGEMLGLPGNDRRVSFKIFHVFDFADGLIRREQVWIDSGAIVAQLSAV
jgi:hypothetical protein